MRPTKIAYNMMDQGISEQEISKFLREKHFVSIDKYNLSNDFISVFDNSFKGVLRIGASTTIAQYVLPQILPKFQKKYPDIEVILPSGNSKTISNDLNKAAKYTKKLK